MDFKWVLRPSWRVVLAWLVLMSGVLSVTREFYFSYMAANGNPVPARAVWDILGHLSLAAFVIAGGGLLVAETKRADAAEVRVAQADARASDSGTATRARNQILSGVATFLHQGNALREAVPLPSAGLDLQAVGAWKQAVTSWTDATNGFLLTHSQSASAKFDYMGGLSVQALPRVHYMLHDDFVVLERRLENLASVCDNANTYLT